MQNAEGAWKVQHCTQRWVTMKTLHSLFNWNKNLGGNFSGTLGIFKRNLSLQRNKLFDFQKN